MKIRCETHHGRILRACCPNRIQVGRAAPRAPHSSGNRKWGGFSQARRRARSDAPYLSDSETIWATRPQEALHTPLTTRLTIEMPRRPGEFLASRERRYGPGIAR